MKTVSLGLAKQLKQFGYSQESYFSWSRVTRDVNGESHPWQLSDKQDLSLPRMFEKHGRADIVAAPNADEILDSLPASIITGEGKYELGLEMRKVGKFWEIDYADIEDVDNGGFHDLIGISDKSLADAAAKMWLYLKEHNLLE